MAQKFYLHDATSTDTGTLPTTWQGATATGMPNDAGAATVRAMDATIGAAQVTVTYPAMGKLSDAWIRQFASAPLSAQTIAAGNWTLSEAVSSASSGATASRIVIFVWRPSSGALVGVIYDGSATNDTTASSAAETAVSTVVAGSSVVALDGDVLVIQVALQNATLTIQNDLWYYDGTTEGSAASNAAYLLAPNDLPLLPPPPAATWQLIDSAPVDLNMAPEAVPAAWTDDYYGPPTSIHFAPEGGPYIAPGISDSATADDALLGPAALSGPGETPAGTDSPLRAAFSGLTEASSGADALGPLSLSGLTDAGAGSEALSGPAALQGPQEAGSGADTTATAGLSGPSEASSGSEALAGGLHTGAGDTAAAVDALALLVLQGLADAAAGTDALAGLAPILQTALQEQATATDALLSLLLSGPTEAAIAADYAIPNVAPSPPGPTGGGGWAWLGPTLRRTQLTARQIERAIERVREQLRRERAEDLAPSTELRLEDVEQLIALYYAGHLELAEVAAILVALS